jgi:predicted component of type VI protein secretion system
MKHHLAKPSVPLAILLGCLVSPACTTGASQQRAPEQVDALVGWVERVHLEADRSKVALADSFERLNTLAAGKFGREPVVTVYARFVQAIDAAEQQSRRFGEAVAPMQESARPVFEQWQVDVSTIGTERLRQRSEMRLAVSRERYEAIVAAAVPAQQQLEAYVRTLRDHATFLAHDLNPGALDAIQEDVKEVAKAARTLDRGLDDCLVAARAYVEQAALPASPGPAAPVR